MSAASALGFLALASARNGIRGAARRLRTPRHFFAALVGLGWLLFVLVSSQLNMTRGLRALSAQGTSGPSIAWAAEVVSLAVLCAVIVGHWVFGRDEAALLFTEAEVQILFAAPLTRRQIVVYKIAKSAIAGLLVLLVLALLLGRGGVLSRLSSGLAGWVAMTIVSLHTTGAALTRAALAQHGVPALRRRTLTLAVALLATVATIVGLMRAPPLHAFPGGSAGLEAWSRAVLDTAPLSWALVPLRVPLDAAFAPGGTPSAIAIVVTLAVLVAHVVWVISSDVAFEESALERAQRFARRVDAVAGSGLQVARKHRRTFRIRAPGSVEGALLWKGSIRARRFVPVQTVALAAGLLVGIPVVVGMASFMAREIAGTVLALLSTLFFFAVVVVGPAFAAGDLRRDLPHLEILRALPARGRRIVLGEIAFPLAQLSAVQWLVLAIATTLSGHLVPLGLGERVAIGSGLALLGPPLSALSLLAHNAVVVMYPSWFPRPGQLRVSFDRLGVPMIMAAASMAVLAVALVPASVAMAMVVLLLRSWMGLYVLPIAALVGAALLVATGAIAAAAVGYAFDRVDPCA